LEEHNVPITGKTLIEWGYKPAPWFREALVAANAAPTQKDARREITAAKLAFELEQAKALEPLEGVVGEPNDSTPPLHIVGEHEEKTIQQLARCARYGSVAGAAICADGHLGYAQPVGGVIAYHEHISVSGVGFDIACGNMAVRTDARADDFTNNDWSKLADDIATTLSFGVGRRNDERVEHQLFDDEEAWQAAGTEDLRQMAQAQLGTIGSGNHYVDVLVDGNGWVWIGVHFGSRGLGHKTATRYLKMAGGADGIDVAPTVLHVESEIGQRYLAAMELAGRYAYAGREWVVDRVRSMLCVHSTLTVHNHHNFAWRERHGEHDLWVVRKGATPAFPGQQGFIGGSMGDDAVIVEGVGGEASEKLFHSTVHGAGRLFGRREAIRRFDQADMDAWVRTRGVHLRGAGLDESPMAYRRLDDVLAYHADTIRVVARLRPVVVVMAGAGEVDPYKD
jgi:tRNA-splicing ligase RtcB (3'-phosphate/5'-hydroxy nucleic acid ligase)